VARSDGCNIRRLQKRPSLARPSNRGKHHACERSGACADADVPTADAAVASRAAIGALLEGVEREDDKAAAAAALLALAEVLRAGGASGGSAFDPAVLERLSTAAAAVFAGEANCQAWAPLPSARCRM
jgi:hypothetical protein